MTFWDMALSGFAFGFFGYIGVWCSMVALPFKAMKNTTIVLRQSQDEE